MQLEDWLDDLCVRFIVNLPPEELVSVERICFQVEEAQWFYEDFIRPLDPSLPSLSLKAFSLRIFQHCPLFSTWSMHHYTTAFAEFLAYKQRVPVRGAIMLNDEMDEVVLVKGWKKGANWSFPRGKINKDENDLDCAIREVYEETGFDIQTAGLVKPEKDMKYIEVTMREQHMRLYVFRGVPKDTHFEPKTRKEISKIEWYKLTDLPTLKKKHNHQDTQDESAALNANKFYMVAPFLHPLKKWITQQKKKENRFSSSYLALPPMTIDESATEGEPGPATFTDYEPKLTSPQVPSSLPELAITAHQHPPQDPSVHLKELLKIGAGPQHTEPVFQPTHVLNADAAKSNALLSLLRGGSTTDGHSNIQASLEQMPLQAQAPRISQRRIDQPESLIDVSQTRPRLPVNQPHLPDQQRSLLDLFASANTLALKPRDVTESHPLGADHAMRRPTEQLMAPYQRTGDPEFSRNSPEDTRGPLVPPANALPKLTHHTRVLLDAFKAAPPSVAQISQQAPQAIPPSLAPNKQALLEAFKTPITSQAKPIAVTSGGRLSPPPPHVPPRSNVQPGSSNASSLLSLFKKPEKVALSMNNQGEEPLQPPVELAAGPIASPKPQVAQHQVDLLSTLLRKDAPKRPPQATRAGETAATIEGPLNQPHFESVTKSPSQLSADSMRRSPVPAHRTLFDPKQPTPTKILQRAEENKKQHAKSPRQSKANANQSSPKQKGRKQEKPFQPQILKRPQTADSRDNALPSPTLVTNMEDIRKEPSPLLPPVTASPVSITMAPISPTVSADIPHRTSHQTETQKQNLLSLLTGPNRPIPATKPRQISTPTPGAISPLTQSQIVSPIAEETPISTRSRMGSLVSVTSTNVTHEPRQKVEKRQTTAGDKAFLLGYLGRIANQEGQAQ